MAASPTVHDLVIRSGTIIDGTGAALREGDIAMKDGTLLAYLGDLNGASRRGAAPQKHYWNEAVRKCTSFAPDTPQLRQYEHVWAPMPVDYSELPRIATAHGCPPPRLLSDEF
jgi:hypothetical protein